MKKYALIGKDIQGSLSPTIHIAYGCQYDLLDVEEDRLEWALQQDYDGFNVTSPYKTKVGKYLSAYWSDTGSINTIVVNRYSGQRLFGFDTDSTGFTRAIELAGLPLPASSVGIIGDGAMARMVKSVLLKNDIRTAITTAENGKIKMGMEALINCSPCEEFNFKQIHYSTWVMDLNYKDDTFIKAARANGNFAFNGINMLIEQARESQRIWNNQL